jgi:hypothetical protein
MSSNTSTEDSLEKREENLLDDRVLDALEELAAILEKVVREEKLLISRIVEARQLRLYGATWSEILKQENDPNTVQLLSQMLALVSGVSGKFRRALVLSLRDEGMSILSIARLFGVTHQRVSNLLHRPHS